MPENPHTADAQDRLLALLRAREQEGMRLLFRDYGGALLHLIGKILVVPADAEETLHDVLLRIWESIDQYDDSKGRLFTWMARIARNAAIDKTRTKNFRRWKKTDLLDELVSKREELSHTPGTDGIGVRKLLAGLDDNHRSVIELLYFQDYTQAETAEALNMPLGTVKTRARNALRQLRGVLRLEMIWLLLLPTGLLTIKYLLS